MAGLRPATAMARPRKSEGGGGRIASVGSVEKDPPRA